ncbi:hypothetical protein [Microvirga zambiensis]|uniref:hypothetical protein n=1 Tax=Microvirga zambiensis TaxID=1402137 RepID=UPI00191E6E66|nr:hypothetical protein [Microvirga zambiensis]
MNSATHPALIFYGSTRDPRHRFPLILVVGREPNHSAPVEMVAGPYDFDGLTPADRKAARNCGFWHMAYRITGRMHDMGDPSRSASWLKDHCRQRRCSPIIIADAIPQGQLNAVADKGIVRQQMREHLAAHARGIFELDPAVMKRVGLVLLSGLDGTVFEPSAQAIREEAEHRAIPCQAIRFLSPRNGRKFFKEDILATARPNLRERYLTSSLTEPCIATTRRIVSEFLMVAHAR